MTTRRRLPMTVAAVVCLGVGLAVTGCTSSQPEQPGQDGSVGASTEQAGGGQTVESARQQLASTPGLTDTSLTVNEKVSGLQKQRRLWFEATTASTDAAEQKRLVEYMVALGWSIGDVDADGGVSVRLHTEPQVVVGDLIADDYSGLEYRSTPDSFKELVVVPRASIQEHLGDAPGAEPTAP